MMSIDIHVGPTCPMCGAPAAAADATCSSCGEPLRTSMAADLSVPIYSLRLIGWCTFFWSIPAGFVLLWLNCRRLNRQREATRVAIFGFAALGVLCAAMFAMPDAP